LINFTTDYFCLTFICLTQRELNLCNAFISKHIVYQTTTAVAWSCGTK